MLRQLPLSPSGEADIEGTRQTTGVLKMKSTMARATNRRRSTRRATAKRRQLSRSIVKKIDQTKYLGIKAGARSDHRFIGICSPAPNEQGLPWILSNCCETPYDTAPREVVELYLRSLPEQAAV